MTVPSATRQASGDRTGPATHTGLAMTVIMTGVLMTAVDTTMAFAIFVGTTPLHGVAARALTNGLHAAFYASVGFMVLAAVLSAIRAKGTTRPAAAGPD